ncbi:hypothetical protein VNI00_008541 [Paramarasmius palmivorus]|uniref:F-box domain-containing protein n=1 Tax=Paramarasmius palmivorus TaxID=297713 RepID=A0AAW0CWQ3_9AGAR
MHQSPFLNKTGTNFVPSPAEKLEIRQLISARQERLAQLQAEQEELQSFIDNHIPLVAPIRRIHADILREIFIHSIPLHDVPFPRTLDAPLLFTAVCRLWREVAVSTPELWNRIHIALPRPKCLPITDEFRSFMHLWGEGVRIWLERSGTRPLALSDGIKKIFTTSTAELSSLEELECRSIW